MANSRSWNTPARHTLLAWLIRFGAHSRALSGLAARLAMRSVGRPADELQSAPAKLQEASGILDSVFLNLQRTLEELAGRASELLERGQSMVRMASGQETGKADFARTISVLETPLAYLEFAQKEMRGLAGELRASMDTVGRLLAAEQTLERAIAPLRFTQVIFSIESARLSEEARQVFGGLTTGFSLLHEKVQVSVREHFRTLSETYVRLRETVKSLDRQSREQLQDLHHKQEQMNRSLVSLADEIASSRGRDVQLTKASSQLAQQVNRAVVGLQAHDIVSQKLAHAQAGLQEVLDAVARCRAGEMPAFERVPTLAGIEAAQMEAVVCELERSGKLLRDSVRGISGELERLESECLMLREFHEITASVNGTIQVLLDSLGGVRGLVGTTVSIAARTEEMIRPVGAAAASLTSTVEGVAHEMRMIALNAQIQAIQIGHGTGLEVLAAHTSEISGAITGLGAKIAEELADTAAKLARDIDRLARLRALGESEMAKLTTEGVREEASLHGCRDEMLEQVRHVGQLLEEAQGVGKGMLASIDLGPAAQRISEVQARVARLVEASAALGRPFAGSNAAAHADSLQRSYTMASERVVHRDMLEKLGHQDLPEDLSAVELGEASTGVELF